MNSVYRVSVPKTEQPPDFPDQCLGCGFDHPEATYDIVTKRRGPAWRIMHWVISPGGKIRVPLCNRCEARIRKRRTISAIAWKGIVYGLMALAYYAFGVPGLFFLRFLQASIVLGAINILLIFWMRWEDKHPIPFDVSDYGSRMEFEFTNEQLAQQFSALNDTGQEAIAFRSAEDLDYDLERNRTTACRA
jgi:hypothetical protein